MKINFKIIGVAFLTTLITIIGCKKKETTTFTPVPETPVTPTPTNPTTPTATVSFTVTFETNGGTSVSPQNVKSGEKASEPKLTKTNYVVEAWYEDATFTKLFVFTNPINENKTLYAKWVYNFETSTDGLANGEIKIINFNKILEENIVVPAIVKGKTLVAIEGTIDVGEENGNPKVNNTTKTVKLPIGLTSIGSYSFYNFSSIQSLELPNTVIEIKNDAFNNCTGLTYISLSNKLQTIGDFGFSGCYKLKQINIPNTIVSIGHRAFSFCTSLIDFTINNDVPPTFGYSIFEYSFKPSLSIYVPINSLDLYKTEPNFNAYSNQIYPIK